MRQAVTASAVFIMLTFASLLSAQEPSPDALFTPDQLDNLLAPVALYPDPLLAQVLLAATFPDQLGNAARFVRANSNIADIDAQDWDVSVKAVAHYPTVLDMMSDQLDWATSLGQAYVNQPDDVMESVQRLRAQAQAAGNLQSDAQMQVVQDDGDIEIWPAQPLYLYVPEYDPSVVYVQHGGFFFGSGYFIGVWLNYDVDWHTHRVFYHGWNRSQGWIARSRPYVHTLETTYVNDRFSKVSGNGSIVNRPVNYSNLNRYESVHHDVGYGRVHPDHRPSNSVKTLEGSVVNKPRNRGSGQESAPVALPAPESHRTFTPAPSRPVVRPVERPAEHGQPPSVARESSTRQLEPRREAPRPALESRPAPAPRNEPARSEAARPAPAAHDDGGKKK